MMLSIASKIGVGGVLMILVVLVIVCLIVGHFIAKEWKE